MADDLIDSLQTRLGYRFASPEFLREALTHRSYANERRDGLRGDNERLEFLGDAVLGLVIAEELFLRYPDHPEGELTRIRAEIVNAVVLADAARSLGLGAALALGRGEEKTGGREKESLLADALEAVFGAVFRDGGLLAARQVILPLFSGRMDRQGLPGEPGNDGKTRLQEYLQARRLPPPEYLLIATEGPDHDRSFRVTVRAGDGVSADGQGRSKKEAEQIAARGALELLMKAENKP